MKIIIAILVTIGCGIAFFAVAAWDTLHNGKNEEDQLHDYD